MRLNFSIRSNNRDGAHPHIFAGNIYMKRRAKVRNTRKTRHRSQAHVVRKLARSGLVEDEIALRLGIDKNTLRARYIDAIKRGRRMARAGEVDDMTREEIHAANAILSAINSEWHTADGNDLWPGLDGGGAKSAADAFAKWQLDGGKFICTGLSARFERERVAELRRIKAEAEALLYGAAPGLNNDRRN
jgi:hypothetical protein